MEFCHLTLVLLPTHTYPWFPVTKLTQNVTASLPALALCWKPNSIALVFVSIKGVRNMQGFFSWKPKFGLFWAGHLLPCEPKVMIDAYSSEIAAAIREKNYKCPKDCISDEYHVSPSTTQLHLGDHDDMHMEEEHDDNMVHSAIHFFYPSFTYTVIKNHPQSVVKWLSN